MMSDIVGRITQLTDTQADVISGQILSKITERQQAIDSLQAELKIVIEENARLKETIKTLSFKSNEIKRLRKITCDIKESLDEFFECLSDINYETMK